MSGAPGAQERSLQQGLKMLDEISVQVDDILKLEKVAESLGISREAMSRPWRPQPKERFSDELLKRAIDPNRFHVMEQVPELLAKVVDNDYSAAALRLMLVADLDAVAEDEPFGSQLLLMSGKPDVRRRSAVLRMYAVFDQKLQPVLEEALRFWGRKVPEPFNIEQLALLINSIVEGIAMRQRTDRHANLGELYSGTILALLLEMTCPLDDDDSVFDRAEVISSWRAEVGAPVPG